MSEWLKMGEGREYIENDDWASLALREASMSDTGWQRMSGGANNLDLDSAARRRIVWRARQFARWDSIVRQTIALYTNFSIGTGFSWSAVDDDAEVANALATLVKTNENIFAVESQRLLSDSLYTDGEIFFVIFSSPGRVNIRTIDPLEITSIGVNPDDKIDKHIYKRTFRTSGFGEKTAYYADWKWDGKGQTVDESGEPIDVKQLADGVIYHVKLMGRGLRGESGLIANMDWSKQYRAFMSARAAVARAIATFAYKAKVKGNAESLAALRRTMGTGIDASTETGETNPPPVAGSSWLENENITLTSMSQETGASAAKVDAGLFMQMAGLGSGIFPHYYGLDNSYRLATATSMEPPMMKAFENYQSLWADIYENLLKYGLELLGIAEERRIINTAAAPIQEQNREATIAAIVKLVQTFPSLADNKDLQTFALQLLGVNDAEDIVGRREESQRIPRSTIAEHVASILREVMKDEVSEDR